MDGEVEHRKYQYQTVELFCGTKSFSKVAAALGHDTFTVDWDERFAPDLCMDIRMIQPYIHLPHPFLLWASPPCTCFSVASIGKHWTGGHRSYTPRTDEAEQAIKIIYKTVSLIVDMRPHFWFIENPRGILRKLIDNILIGHDITDYIRRTVTYCQYGDTRMKPTDVWTNFLDWTPRAMCRNGDDCHEAAPRGSRTGTQGLSGPAERSVIPPDLFLEIFNDLKAWGNRTEAEGLDGN